MRPPLALAALALAGCPRVPPPDLSRDPGELFAAVEAAQAKCQRVKGSARLHLATSQVKGSVDVFAAAQKPDRVHVEVMDFFGNPAAVLVADGARFAFFDARSGAFYRGASDPATLRALLPLPGGPAELAQALCGAAPILPGARAAGVRAKDGALLLALDAAGARQTLSVGAEAAVEASRAPGLALDFGLFRHEGGVRFPTELTAKAAGVEASLAWKQDLEVNGPADAALFELAPPAGARVVEVQPGAPPPRVDLPLHPDEKKE